ncbi:MAG: EscU/YscU/HrcU family type III secretion system export apparatus switch protein [Methylocystaceae bacterium]|nr:EscU/YscU/HrcU family type III secretion system export apparatus switch protein [Methylocystaceae bacterium]
MSDDKSEDATATRIDKAKQDGKTFRSKDSTVLSSIILVVYFYFYGWGTVQDRLDQLFNQTLEFVSGRPATSVFESIQLVFTAVSDILIPFFSTLIVVNVFLSIAIGGPIFSFQLLAPNFEKLNPVSGFSRIFSKSNLFDFGKGIALILIILLILFFQIRRVLPSVMSIDNCDLNCFTMIFGRESLFFVNVLIGILIVLVLLDISVQKAIHLESLKMSKEEVKKEHKQKEGDPQVKSSRKQAAKEMLDQKSIALSRANVAVWSNKKILVALYYNPNEMPLPICVIKGAGPGALRLVRDCRKFGVPVVDGAEIAERFFKELRIGFPILEKHINDAVLVLRSAG